MQSLNAFKDSTATITAILTQPICLGPGGSLALCSLAPCAAAAMCREALNAYQEAVSYAPNNQVALQRSEFCKQKLERLSTTSL